MCSVLRTWHIPNIPLQWSTLHHEAAKKKKKSLNSTGKALLPTYEYALNMAEYCVDKDAAAISEVGKKELTLVILDARTRPGTALPPCPLPSGITSRTESVPWSRGVEWTEVVFQKKEEEKSRCLSALSISYYSQPKRKKKKIRSIVSREAGTRNSGTARQLMCRLYFHSASSLSHTYVACCCCSPWCPSCAA